jgi:hypothetical protein
VDRIVPGEMRMGIAHAGSTEGHLSGVRGLGVEEPSAGAPRIQNSEGIAKLGRHVPTAVGDWSACCLEDRETQVRDVSQVGQAC